MRVRQRVGYCNTEPFRPRGMFRQDDAISLYARHHDASAMDTSGKPRSRARENGSRERAILVAAPCLLLGGKKKVATPESSDKFEI